MPASRSKRRRLSTTDVSDSEDFVHTSTPIQGSSSRPRRGQTSSTNERTTIERSSPHDEAPAAGGSRLRLTVKAPPRKLREATSGSGKGEKTGVNSRDSLLSGNIITGPRSTRKKAIVEESSEEDDEEDEDMDNDGDEDEEVAEEEEPDEDEAEDDDAEGEDDDEDADGDDDEDVEMEDAPPIHPVPPAHARLKTQPPPPKVTVTSASQKKTTREFPSVETKEMAMAEDDDDDELSDLDSPEEVDVGEEDGEGDEDDEEEEEEDDAEGEEVDGEEEENGSSDDVTPSMSRGETPDLSKLTRRQRAAYEDLDGGGLMALSNEAQKKKHLTAEEHAMRRAEMARRRKNLSEKRNEEEKMDTINRLLKKQAPKRRRRAELSEALREEGEDEDADMPKAPAVFTRYVQTVETGASLGVPSEWIAEGQPLGTVFTGRQMAVNKKTRWTGRMVEEVA